jgi:hypothetical protein
VGRNRNRYGVAERKLLMAGMEVEWVPHDVRIFNVQTGGTNSDHYTLKPSLSILAHGTLKSYRTY